MRRSAVRLVPLVYLISLLVGCGGGGSGSGTQSGSQQTTRKLAFVSWTTFNANSTPTGTGFIVYSPDPSSGQFSQLFAVTPPSNADSITLSVNPVFPFLYDIEGNSQGTYRITPSTGNVGQLSLTALLFSEPPIFNPQGTLAFAKASGGGMAMFTVNTSTGALSPVSGSPFFPGVHLTPLVVDMTGQFLYAGDFNNNLVTAYRIDSTQNTITQIGASLSTGPQPTIGAIESSGNFLFVGVTANQVGQDKAGISEFRIDSQTGALTPLPFVSFAALQGLAADTNERLYVSEAPFGAEATLLGFVVDPTSGTLTPTPGSPYDLQFQAGILNFGGNIAIDPDDAFLWVSTPGAVHVYSLNATTGAPTFMPNSSQGVTGQVGTLTVLKVTGQ